MNTETIKEIDVQSVMTKSALPVGGYSVNRVSGREELETDSQSAQI